jgi:CubicO group peptidase (beta-lactamase class C family)
VVLAADSVDTVGAVVDGARAAGLAGSAVSAAVQWPDGAVVRVDRGTLAHGDPVEPGRTVGTALFDLASLTKTFVAVAALSLVDDGTVDLDARIAERVHVGTGDGAEDVTLRHLLTHTAGLPASSPLWREEPDADRLLERVLATPLTTPPGSTHTYSCLGYIAVGHLLEVVCGARLDTIVRERVLEPLGAPSARYGPVDPASAAATETQPHRGHVRGAVHDELAHAIGRPVGNAGLFGTAQDLLALGEMLLDGGRGRVGRVLRTATAELLTEPAVRPGTAAAPYGQAVGFRVGDPTFMGSVSGIGHTGFTGTSLVVDPRRRTMTVLLTNRVHPTRETADVGPLRRALADAVAGQVDRSLH